MPAEGFAGGRGVAGAGVGRAGKIRVRPGILHRMEAARKAVESKIDQFVQRCRRGGFLPSTFKSPALINVGVRPGAGLILLADVPAEPRPNTRPGRHRPEVCRRSVSGAAEAGCCRRPPGSPAGCVRSRPPWRPSPRSSRGTGCAPSFPLGRPARLAAAACGPAHRRRGDYRPDD